MMNLPLLYRASTHTGYDHYRSVAATHTATTAEYAIREDGSTAHGIAFDVETGAFEGQCTHQSYSDGSCWSRGQAWTIYGMGLSYRHTGRDEFLGAAQDTAEYYLEEVPADWVPPWDFDAEEGVDDLDSSAAAIAACGFLELASHLPQTDPDRRQYETAGLATLESLSESYTTEGESSNGILTHGAYNRNDGEYDQCTIWGDYFFLESLVRATRNWTPWWAREAVQN
jgi:unsaturated chondroitin disaccharide hydrolase